MRLGEIKNIITTCLNDNEQISISNEAQYGGQAQLVHNYQEIITALEVLNEQLWNNLDYAPIEEIKGSHHVFTNPVLLTREEFDKMNAYVSAINQKLPVFIGLLETMVEEQDPQIINIKLPEKIKSIEDLDKFNKRLVNIFKRFNLAGKFEFKGLDKGTSWYEILITTPILYRYFLACLALALSILTLKKTYYEAENARLTYKALKKESAEYKEAELLEKVAEEKIVEGVEFSIKEIGEKNGKTEEELKSELINATKELVKELGEGTEFHLSFNPPAFAREASGALEIDYKKMPKLSPEAKIEELEEAPEVSPSDPEKND